MDYPVKTLLQLRPLLVGFRKAAGLTQARMASHLGVTQQTYAQLEAKPESASLDRLFHVLKMLNVEIVLTQVPVAVRQGVTQKGATIVAAKTVAAKTATTKTSAARKAAATPARGSGQSSPKPLARKLMAPMAAAPKKREDW